MSADSLARITEGWGQQVEAQRQAEAERANGIAQRGESPRTRRIATITPIAGQANISTDGAKVLIRGEGWKEVKLTAISEVQVQAATAPPDSVGQGSRRADDVKVKLSQHSYQAGLWDADGVAAYQYLEGLRRGLDQCAKLSSVNDAAAWIERITRTNFPHAVQIVDWSHASGRLWAVANATLGDQSAEAKQWAARQLDQLWSGGVAEVITTLKSLGLDAEGYLPDVRQAPGYFESNQARMRYDVFRAAGYPIGSGTVESGVNTVVHHRMRRPGRGWWRENGQAMLAGLSELHSQRFDLAWQATLPLAA